MFVTRLILNNYKIRMKSITPKALKLALSIKKSIKDHCLYDASLIQITYEDKYDYGYDYLQNEYDYTYKDYDNLRLIMAKIILHLIIYDVKNKKRKHKKKIISLMSVFNNTCLYFTYPYHSYLYEFQMFVINIIFRYYKDYVYKAQWEYHFKEELPVAVAAGFDYESYGLIKLKILFYLFKSMPSEYRRPRYRYR